MRVIIPMAGSGERFRRAGYTLPKPLIDVDGRPMIAHVLDQFPAEWPVLFGVSRAHLEDPALNLAETLLSLRPNAQIVAVEPHKLGPVWTLKDMIAHIDANQPAIVTYCDWASAWDPEHFLRFVRESGCDAAVQAYRGFHPHTLRSAFHAYIREKDGWMLDIQEKRPYTNQPTAEFASNGIHYFSSGQCLAKAVEQSVARDMRAVGEFFVSIACKALADDGARIAVYEVPHFHNWGTPEDFAEWQGWRRTFARLTEIRHPASHSGTVLVPMAGLGERFSRAGFTLAKPLIPVSGRPMAVQALADLPEAPHRVVILRTDMHGRADVEVALKQAFPDLTIIRLDAPTDGQARTCLLGLDGADPDAPLTIGACDTGAVYDPARLMALLLPNGPDVVIWTMRGHPGAERQPQAYSWVDADDTGRVRGISVKSPLGNPARDPILVGNFTFRRARDFKAAAMRMIRKDARMGNEFYVDQCINEALEMGLRVAMLELDHFLCWGTPDDLATFEYWQSCFHKLRSHPYDLHTDSRIPVLEMPKLRAKCALIRPDLPI